MSTPKMSTHKNMSTPESTPEKLYANIPDDDDDEDEDEDDSDVGSVDSNSNQMQVDTSKSEEVEEDDDDDDEFVSCEELDDETTLIQAEQEDGNEKPETQKELMDRLEKEGMNKMQELNVKIDRGDLPPFGKEHIDQVMQVMQDGEKEFREKTGRNMTHAERRAMYG